jgi:hypothetical protein
MPGPGQVGGRQPSRCPAPRYTRSRVPTDGPPAVRHCGCCAPPRQALSTTGHGAAEVALARWSRQYDLEAARCRWRQRPAFSQGQPRLHLGGGLALSYVHHRGVHGGYSLQLGRQCWAAAGGYHGSGGASLCAGRGPFPPSRIPTSIGSFNTANCLGVCWARGVGIAHHDPRSRGLAG